MTVILRPAPASLVDSVTLAPCISGDLPHDRKPQPTAAGSGIAAAIEAVKNTFAFVGWNAGTVVLHDHLHV